MSKILFKVLIKFNVYNNLKYNIIIINVGPTQALQTFVVKSM